MNNEMVQEVVLQEGFANENEFDILNQKGLPVYYSLVAKTQPEKVLLFNALNSPQKRVEDSINMTIDLRHILIETITIEDEFTREKINAPRIILIDAKNETYACVSIGMFGSVKRIISIFGEPNSWKNPLKVKIVQKSTRTGNNKVLTLELA